MNRRLEFCRKCPCFEKKTRPSRDNWRGWIFWGCIYPGDVVMTCRKYADRGDEMHNGEYLGFDWMWETTPIPDDCVFYAEHCVKEYNK